MRRRRLLMFLFTILGPAPLLACGSGDSGSPSSGPGEPGEATPVEPSAPTPPAAAGVIPLGGLGWQTSGGWELVEAGVIEGTGELTSIGDVTDIAVSFECQLQEGTMDGVSLAFRERSVASGGAQPTGYRAIFDPSGRVMLSKPGDPRFAPEHQAGPRFRAEGWNRIRIRTVGPRHEVQLNDARAASAEDPQHAAGRFALRIPATARLRCRSFDVSPGG